uniref:Uncharacterized protein n=1 Tax=Glossina austeni TaxID=7395 RepID=A0A1A9UPQ0_GLOAU
MLIAGNTTLKPAATTATAMPQSAATSPSSPLITMMTTTINTSTTATSVLPVMSSSISTPPVSAESPTVQSLNTTTNTKCDAPFGNETSPCNSGIRIVTLSGGYCNANVDSCKIAELMLAQPFC